jgi:CheY-like chemotaxis protein
MDASSASTLPAARALRVLVVEDLPRVRTLLRELIEEPDRLEVAAFAETEEEALRRFDELRPDAVVVDLKLRAGTGIGVVHGIRARAAAPRPLVIVLTNHALPVLESACLQAGADHFLDKSRDFHKVRPLLEKARDSAGPSPDS